MKIDALSDTLSDALLDTLSTPPVLHQTGSSGFRAQHAIDPYGNRWGSIPRQEHRMSTQSGVNIWATRAWRDLALTWLDEHLAAEGITRTGDADQPHLRPWATALRIPTTVGPVWLKATGPGTAFEVRLYALLNEVVPEGILTPLAIDPDRSWIVLPDGGSTLGDHIESGEIDLAVALGTILPCYAELQRSPRMPSACTAWVSRTCGRRSSPNAFRKRSTSRRHG